MLPRKLGRLPSLLDIRDYQLKNYISARKLDVSGNRLWEYAVDPLDQGDTNHCVGFAMANFGINLPVMDDYTNDDGHDFYYMCKVFDADPKGENGTSIRSAAKVLKNVGIIDSFAFAASTDEISWWILNKGPVIVGTTWTLDMFTPDGGNIIHPTGEVVGGHGYLLNEKKDNYYGIQNSWDEVWGIDGKAYISIDDFGILFRHGGEAIASVELPEHKKSDGCLSAILNLFNS